MFFQYSVLDAVLVPISQGTEVTIVTEYNGCFIFMDCRRNIIKIVQMKYTIIKSIFWSSRSILC